MRHPPQLASRSMDLTATELHFATVFEAMADAFGDADAVVHGTERMLWSEYDDAAACIAGFLEANGIGTDQKVGLFLYNSNEYLTAQYATFKNRAVPVNVNYRYLDDELAYLLENADVEALFFHDSLADRVARVSDRLPKLRVMVQVPERAESGTTGLVSGATWWSDAIAADPAPRRARSADEVYMLFTGGTTGMPKGVMFRMGDFVNRMLGGCYAYRGWTPPASPADILPFARAHAEQGARRVSIPACPLMHGTGMWLGAIYAHLLGGSDTLPPLSLNPYSEPEDQEEEHSGFKDSVLVKNSGSSLDGNVRRGKVLSYNDHDENSSMNKASLDDGDEFDAIGMGFDNDDDNDDENDDDGMEDDWMEDDDDESETKIIAPRPSPKKKPQQPRGGDRGSRPERSSTRKVSARAGSSNLESNASSPRTKTAGRPTGPNSGARGRTPAPRKGSAGGRKGGPSSRSGSTAGRPGSNRPNKGAARTGSGFGVTKTSGAREGFGGGGGASRSTGPSTRSASPARKKSGGSGRSFGGPKGKKSGGKGRSPGKR